jgi:hypothetical protein
MTASPFADPTPAPNPGRVRMERGRYKLPDPDTGKDALFTRVSNIAKVLEDTYHLDQWKDRMLAKGLSMRPDLVMLAGATPLDEKWKFAQDIVKPARDTAGGSEGANHGTAFHSLTEIVDRGEPIPQGTHPDNVKRLELYRQSLKDNRLAVIPDWMERVVLNREHRIVGRTDRALIARDMSVLGDPSTGYGCVIGDVKSQKSMDFGCMSIAMQLAIYAHADLVWNEDEGRWEEPNIELNQDVAVVMHVPSDWPTKEVARAMGGAPCIQADIHVIDIARGWELVQVAMNVRAARKEKLNRKLERPGGNDWGRAIMNASTKQDLSNIWKAADAAGEWTDELLSLGKARQAEIEKGSAQTVAGAA